MPGTPDARRRYAKRHYSTGTPWSHAVNTQVVIPADLVILDRDPSPCFNCGVRADLPCRHRPWMLGS